MSVFVKTISEMVALFLQSLRLSFILPAALFVGLNVGFIFPVFKDSQLHQLFVDQDLLLPVSVALIFAIVMIAYILAVLNLPIIRFFEGYPLLGTPIGRRLRLSNYIRVIYLKKQIEELEQRRRHHEEQAKRLQEEGKEKAAQAEFGRAYFYELRSKILGNELIWLYPSHQIWRILPTRLGNVIAAAEEYPARLFGIDSVTFWPFLVPILEEQKYAAFIEKEKSLLDFPLNMAVITLAFGTEMLVVDSVMGQPNCLLSLMKFAIAMTMAFSFYLLSIQGAINWGYTIRTAFVLFKDHLRCRLGLARVEGYHQEFSLWEDASQFYRDHDISLGPCIFDKQKCPLLFEKCHHYKGQSNEDEREKEK